MLHAMESETCPKCSHPVNDGPKCAAKGCTCAYAPQGFIVQLMPGSLPIVGSGGNGGSPVVITSLKLRAGETYEPASGIKLTGPIQIF